MIDQIFICYAREDRARVEALYDRLKADGVNPWMDKKNLTPGDDWKPKIKQAIRNSHFFLAVLTNNSINKKGELNSEIARALEEQEKLPEGEKYIIPVRLENCTIPERLNMWDCADLFEDKEYKRLLRALTEVDKHHDYPSPPEQLKRPPLCGMRLPCFFPAISGTVKSALSPLNHLEVLLSLKTHLLFSAYDYENAPPKEQRSIRRLLKQAVGDGQTVLLDSGCYEKKWINDSWTKKDYHRTLGSIDFNLAFAFDVSRKKITNDNLSQVITRSLEIDRNKAGFQNISPVIHSSDPNQYPELCKMVAQKGSPVMLGIPERQLGNGIFAVSVCIAKIRQELNSIGRYIPLHILGAGNPLAILMYSTCGADSFDGLDWCQTVVDFESAKLHHRQQLDFYVHQSLFGNEKDLSYPTKVLAHNIEFYKQWMNQIQQYTINGTIQKMLKQYLPQSAYLFMKKQFPERF